jgi:hypothetical protein
MVQIIIFILAVAAIAPAVIAPPPPPPRVIGPGPGFDAVKHASDAAKSGVQIYPQNKDVTDV